VVHFRRDEKDYFDVYENCELKYLSFVPYVFAVTSQAPHSTNWCTTLNVHFFKITEALNCLKYFQHDTGLCS
jgi:hypothetical protein